MNIVLSYIFNKGSLFEAKISIIFHTYVPPYVLKFETGWTISDKLTFVQNEIELLIKYLSLYEYLFETL